MKTTRIAELVKVVWAAEDGGPAGPAVHAAAAELAAAEGTLEGRIVLAALRLGRGTFGIRVMLADLRDRLGDEDRAAVDAALVAMNMDGAIVLYPKDAPRGLRDRDHAAALRVAGERRDLLYLERT